MGGACKGYGLGKGRQARNQKRWRQKQHRTAGGGKKRCKTARKSRKQPQQTTGHQKHVCSWVWCRCVGVCLRICPQCSGRVLSRRITSLASVTKTRRGIAIGVSHLLKVGCMRAKKSLYTWASPFWFSIPNFIFLHRKSFLGCRVGRSKERPREGRRGAKRGKDGGAGG